MTSKTCYYELLSLDRKCEPSEIKSAYRKLALQMHPDKASQNNMTVEEATQRFQVIQEAYSCLSDPQEKAWYDAHREQILRGDDEKGGEDPFKTKMNMYRYMFAGCYTGFADDKEGFFSVYAELFEAIDEEEEQWEDADEEHVAMPPFGRSDSEWSDVSAFYRNWLEFCSRKAFGHADKWNPKDAPNRQVRRAMEQENKKARQLAKTEFNREVRQIVLIVQRRDPRVQVRNKQKLKETLEKSQREAAEKEEKKASDAQERQQRKENSRKAEEERWAEAEAQKAAQRSRGEAVSEDEASSSDGQQAVGYTCEPCRKSFKSEKAFDQHTKSKKHQQIVAKLRKELDLELEQSKGKEESESEDDSSDSAPEDEASPEADVAKANRGAEGSQSNSDSDDDDDEDDEAFLVNFMARSKARVSPTLTFAPPPRMEDGGVPAVASNSDASDACDGGSDDEAKMMEGTGSKKAQKRAKQKVILLEKKKERENVQELVSSVRKAQREDNAAEKTAAEGADAGAEEAVAAAAARRAELEATLRAEISGLKPGALRRQAAALGSTDSALAAADDALDTRAAFVDLIVRLKAEAPPPQAPALKKGRGGAAPKASGAPSATNGQTPSRCGVCSEEFSSRSALFRHIETSGHAALKEEPQEPGKKGKKTNFKTKR